MINLKKLIFEDNVGGGGQRGGGSGQGTGYYKDRLSYDISTPIVLNKDKFKTGTDTIDTSSKEYQKLKNILANLPTSKTKLDISIIGSASTVGNDQGYDNKGLALRRAEKLAAQLMKDIPGLRDKVNLKITGQVVPKTNVPESPQALAAQKITVIFNQKNKQSTFVPIEVDNTAANINKFRPLPVKDEDDDDEEQDIIGDSQSRICIKIDDKYINDYKQMIRDFKLKHGLKIVPISITKI